MGDRPAMPRAGDRMRIHVNLHLRRLVVIPGGSGRVAGYVEDALLTDVTFKVQAGGLRRIRERWQRAVCAYAVGTCKALDSAPDLSGWVKVQFNPFKADTFVRPDGTPVHHAPIVAFRDRAAWIPA